MSGSPWDQLPQDYVDDWEPVAQGVIDAAASLASLAARLRARITGCAAQLAPRRRRPAR